MLMNKMHLLNSVCFCLGLIKHNHSCFSKHLMIQHETCGHIVAGKYLWLGKNMEDIVSE